MSDRLATVSAFLYNRDGEVIAQLRDDKPGLMFPGCWSTLGGRVEIGETPDEAMGRELLEETELETPLTFWRLFEHRFHYKNTIHEANIYAYVGQIDMAAADIHLHEGQRLEFLSAVDIDRLPFAFGLDHLFREFFAAYERSAGDDFSSAR